ncbi:N-acetylmuramoyl-L-alanine amidase [Fictibacillus phosphorivorans]|uniref:N-acetylmuramoyl-L-alanine amidase n=1 Tax=Fictibacillus phosphorivorans TaxID=1221500 RepID=UPI0020418D51|nr:N-acetylmuramoyl-L-alanine amidase [Fictibacillus phosphorivorans]MCM3718655.1 N-acetylmuramoyl-L-alanine amidase [Fictibacillus phosphorivorans]MCM3776278.1 N-acetylmuramoyl-L-alanine amidase [Fictibacillus phosphorivorans]
MKEKYPITNQYIKKELKQRPGGNRTPRYTVAHDTGNPNSTARQNFNYFNSRQLEASAHVFIDDKEILVLIPLHEKAWHVRANVSDANDWAIGVELCYGSSIHFSEAYSRYVWFFAYLCEKFNWDPHTHIKGHFQLDPERRTDPLNCFYQYDKTFPFFLDDVQYELKKMRVNHAVFKDSAISPESLFKVQIGAFSSRENAQKLAEKAKAAGFTVYIEHS